MLPGDPSIEAEESTESESMMMIWAGDRSIVVYIESKSESVSIEIPELDTPSRRARADI